MIYLRLIVCMIGIHHVRPRNALLRRCSFGYHAALVRRNAHRELWIVNCELGTFGIPGNLFLNIIIKINTYIYYYILLLL